MSAIKVLSPGGYTTIQDKGRFGFQNMGIPVSGVMDVFAFMLSNLLVGNPENTAVMELTVMGPSLEITRVMDIALTGATMGIRINDTPVNQWCSLRVKPGDCITIGQVQSGCRAYLAVSGGIKVPQVMGSFSTYVGGKIGGFNGRPLQKNDILETRDIPLLKKVRTIPKQLIPVYSSQAVVRAILGPQDDYFDTGIETIFQSEYMVTAKADRMGYRLQGNTVPIKEGMPKSIVSEPSMPGSIQIPPDQQPIILLVEQTVGGYAKIATVISSDLPIVAQTTPGDTIKFEPVDLKNAHRLILERKNNLNTIKELFTMA
ncbi:MAG: biotin-dependent carboxyltransferase family protein [Proteobacteria bacterium]|nr:biotin-dependent carboxyltransferase family protein [Pseudomonadota bacterium]MBU1585681.1 biotin-dependent carboxyltransferase family protein [Pseudomonadota bacterium]MBU2451892.1 biotin-dependent carboxyltransferase family protein [Pseudomonadota bacterium]